MMCATTIIALFCFFTAQGIAHEIEMNCHENYDFPPVARTASPSFLADLSVELVLLDGKNMLNLSWAVNVDASIEYLTGTRIVTDDEQYHCEYQPALAHANLTGFKQLWFHQLVNVFPGHTTIQAANLPLPPLGSGPSYKFVTIYVTPQFTDPNIVSTTKGKLMESPKKSASLLVVSLGGLAGLVVLTSCFILSKVFRPGFADWLGFTRLPVSPAVHVSVLLVYPAEDPVFQRAVVALAEFLHWHGGCSVAVDFWQQGKIAELGPIRWLAEQSKTAERVIVICPQPRSYPPRHGFLGPSIPATANELYPLVLNMVAGHAKSPSEMAKFWTLQLGECRNGYRRRLPVELMACKKFCLMKDLEKLCRSLHYKRKDSKMTCRIRLGAEKVYIKKSRENLREALGQLTRHQSSTTELQQVHSVITV